MTIKRPPGVDWPTAPPASVKVGDTVVFAHAAAGPRYHVNAFGRHPIAQGSEPFVELAELPGQFAPHLFRIVAEDKLA
jgi:hypothetical protein